MNKYAVVLRINAYVVGYIPPTTLNFSMAGLQYSLAAGSLSTTGGTQLASFDYVMINKFTTDMTQFTTSDSKQGTSTLAVDMMVLVSTAPKFLVGNYLISVTVVLYPNKYNVKSSYNIKYIFSSFNGIFTTPIFTIQFTDQLGNSQGAWMKSYTVKSYDIAINGLTYDAALLKAPAAQVFCDQTFTTTFTSTPQTNVPKQPMDLFATITYMNAVYTPSNSTSIDLEAQVLGVTQPTNVPYQTYTMMGGGAGTVIQYSLLIRNIGFSSVAIPNPDVVPTSTTTITGADDEVGVSEQQLFLAIEDGDMSPATMALAKKRLYKQALVEAYDAKKMETEMVALPNMGRKTRTNDEYAIRQERIVAGTITYKELIEGDDQIGSYESELARDIERLEHAHMRNHPELGHAEGHAEASRHVGPQHVLPSKGVPFTLQKEVEETRVVPQKEEFFLPKKKQEIIQEKKQEIIESVMPPHIMLDEQGNVIDYTDFAYETRERQPEEETRVATLQQEIAESLMLPPLVLDKYGAVIDPTKFSYETRERPPELKPEVEKPTTGGGYFDYNYSTLIAAGAAAVGAVAGAATYILSPKNADVVQIDTSSNDIQQATQILQHKGNILAERTILHSAHLKELWEQRQNDDYENYNEAKLRGSSGKKRKKLFNPSQL